MSINSEDAKYNNIKTRNIAFRILQNSFNKNRGLSYEKAIKDNFSQKEAVDFWLDKYGADVKKLL